MELITAERTKQYCAFLWVLLALAFMGFIALMSYWYPITLDEYFRWKEPFNWEVIKDLYFSIAPRVSILFNIPIYNFGKWFFVLSNSLIQFTNVLLLFYILFIRLPDIKNCKDMPYFLTILCMSVFFICTPSEVMFWLSGAINYTWNITFFLLTLCFVRKIQLTSNNFKDTWFLRISVFIIGLALGMANEALSPVAFISAVALGLFYNYKKIQTPKSLSFLIFGLTLGCLVFFSSPAHYDKMNISIISGASSVSLTQKLFFHIFHFDEFFRAQFFLPVFTALFLIITSLDKDKRDFKNENFWFSLCLLIMGFMMAFILFIVPKPPVRAYYPASVSCLLSFLFFVKYFISVYKIDLSKYLCYTILFISLLLAPRFIIPHYILHLQEKTRISLNLESRPYTKVPPYFVLKGPTENLTISLMDPARREPLGNGIFITDATVPINW